MPLVRRGRPGALASPSGEPATVAENIGDAIIGFVDGELANFAASKQLTTRPCRSIQIWS
jgi:hypothetical protein